MRRLSHLCTLRASLSGTFLQRKDVVNQCLEFATCAGGQKSVAATRIQLYLAPSDGVSYQSAGLPPTWMSQITPSCCSLCPVLVVCVCIKERESVCVCVCKGERERVCVCVCVCVCVNGCTHACMCVCVLGGGRSRVFSSKALAPSVVVKTAMYPTNYSDYLRSFPLTTFTT